MPSWFCSWWQHGTTFSRTKALCARPYLLSPKKRHRNRFKATSQPFLGGRRWGSQPSWSMRELHSLKFSFFFFFFLFFLVCNPFNISRNLSWWHHHLASNEIEWPWSPTVTTDSSLWRWRSDLHNSGPCSIRINSAFRQTQPLRLWTGSWVLGTHLYSAPAMCSQEVEVDIW